MARCPGVPALLALLNEVPHRGAPTFLRSLLSSLSWSSSWATAKLAVRFLVQHTGVPAVVVAAILIAVGYRILKRSARFAVEVMVVTLALVAASELGWIRW